VSGRSRITSTFERLRARGERGLVTYVTAGDPDLARSGELIRAVARAGADVVEVGVPFSDPTADGPVIQAAMQRALAAGTTLSSVLTLVGELRQDLDVPVVLFGYYNPVFVRGPARFAREARAAGADGVLVVDLPPEEAGELCGPLAAEGLDYVPLVAPTSTPARVRRALVAAAGFVYYVSLTGVTGTAIADFDDAQARVGELRQAAGLPVAVGFGITTPDDARRVGTFADAVVVGSAIVRAAERGGAVEAAALVRALKSALR
jgi:tryptophan synthase alpha chain